MDKNESTLVSPLKTILLVDDEDDCRITTKWFLSNFGFTVESARSGEEALALFNPKIHDVIITDNRMSGMSGLEMAHIIKMRSASTPIVMYSGGPPSNGSCVDIFIPRPAHMLVLKEAVDKVLGMNNEQTKILSQPYPKTNSGTRPET